MSTRNTWHPLMIVGLVLLTNALVFLLLSFALQGSDFLGVILGCLGAGVATLLIGYIQSGKNKLVDRE